MLMSSSPERPANSRRLGIIALVVAIVAAILAVIAITVNLFGNASEDDAGGLVVIKYEVTGSGGESEQILYTYPVDGEPESVHASGEFPWSETVTTERENFFVASVGLKAQVTADGGSITCRIWVDGEVISEESASGAFEVVGCSG